MSQGFVYILINPSFIDQVKIGLTKRKSESRATELSKHSGVPTSFIVVYDELVSDCEEVEKRLHLLFAGYRVNKSREFFKVPIKEAVKALQKEARNFPIGDIDDFQKVEILPDLKRLYEDYLKPDITSVKIVHLNNLCFLETTRRTNSRLNDEIIERIDLGFITDGEPEEELKDMFDPKVPVKKNAEIFVRELDPYSLIMCTDLFTEEACHKIDEEYRSSLK